MTAFDELALLHRDLCSISDNGQVERVEERRFSGAIGGRAYDLVAHFEMSREDCDSGALVQATVQIPLKIPLRLLASDKRTSSLSLLRVLTGDAAFDADYRIFGLPSEVLRTAFDAELRADFRSSLAKGPWVEVRDGWIQVSVGFEYDKNGSLGSGLDAIRTHISFAIRFSDRLHEAYQKVLEDIRSRSGAAGEAAWLARTQAEVAATEKTSRRLRWVILGLAALFVLLLLLPFVLTLRYFI